MLTKRAARKNMGQPTMARSGRHQVFRFAFICMCVCVCEAISVCWCEMCSAVDRYTGRCYNRLLFLSCCCSCCCCCCCSWLLMLLTQSLALQLTYIFQIAPLGWSPLNLSKLHTHTHTHIHRYTSACALCAVCFCLQTNGMTVLCCARCVFVNSC